MSFTAKDVATLREKTGCGMMDCKKALTEADGNMERAVELLREKGLAAAAKKAGRIAAEGLVSICYDAAGKAAGIIEVNSETDFAANSDPFRSFVEGCAKTVVNANPADLDALLAAQFEGSGMSIADMTREKVLTIGENISVRRFKRVEGELATYIHGGGRIGVVVKFGVSSGTAEKPEFQEFAKDIAMQVAASSPQYITREEVPSDVIAKEREILTAAAINEGKPQNIAEKMVIGRIEKFYKDICLLEQPFVKDPDRTVKTHVAEVSKAVGESITIAQFVRFEKGEGLQKREDNFADEVAKMNQ